MLCCAISPSYPISYQLYSSPVPVGLAAEALLSGINANAHVISASPMLCLAEEACVASLTALCGWNVVSVCYMGSSKSSTSPPHRLSCSPPHTQDDSDGLTMPGGSASNTLAIQTALNCIFPTFKQSGVIGIVTELMATGRSAHSSRPLIFTGKEGHYSIEKAAIACGLGLDCVVSVPSKGDGSMCTESLERMLEMALSNEEGNGDNDGIVGFPFFINATAGSTVMGAFDDLERIAEICTKFSSAAPSLWKHVDASWGGPILFSSKYRSRMNGVQHFDSLTICAHKMMNM
jgi:glutamate decarboxylase